MLFYQKIKLKKEKNLYLSCDPDVVTKGQLNITAGLTLAIFCCQSLLLLHVLIF